MLKLITIFKNRRKVAANSKLMKTDFNKSSGKSRHFHKCCILLAGASFLAKFLVCSHCRSKAAAASFKSGGICWCKGTILQSRNCAHTHIHPCSPRTQNSTRFRYAMQNGAGNQYWRIQWKPLERFSNVCPQYFSEMRHFCSFYSQAFFLKTKWYCRYYRRLPPLLMSE